LPLERSARLQVGPQTLHDSTDRTQDKRLRLPSSGRRATAWARGLTHRRMLAPRESGLVGGRRDSDGGGGKGAAVLSTGPSPSPPRSLLGRDERRAGDVGRAGGGPARRRIADGGSSSARRNEPLP
jgi:hypothetical protein